MASRPRKEVASRSGLKPYRVPRVARCLPLFRYSCRWRDQLFLRARCRNSLSGFGLIWREERATIQTSTLKCGTGGEDMFGLHLPRGAAFLAKLFRAASSAPLATVFREASGEEFVEGYVTNEARHALICVGFAGDMDSFTEKCASTQDGRCLPCAAAVARLDSTRL